MKRVLNSSEAAWLLHIDASNLTRYARARGVKPLGRVRVGRSYVTRWAVEDIMAIAPAPPPATISRIAN